MIKVRRDQSLKPESQADFVLRHDPKGTGGDAYAPTSILNRESRFGGAFRDVTETKVAYAPTSELNRRSRFGGAFREVAETAVAYAIQFFGN